MREKKEAVRVAGVPEANEKAAMLILVVWYRRRSRSARSAGCAHGERPALFKCGRYCNQSGEVLCAAG